MIIRWALVGAAALSVTACAGMGGRGDVDAGAEASVGPGVQRNADQAPATDKDAAAPVAACRPADAGPLAQTPGQNCGPTGVVGPR